MQLIECDAAINYSCNRSVLELNLSTDRGVQSCRHPCVFCPHSGNVFIPTVASLAPLPLTFVLEGLCPPPTSKGEDQSAGCPFLPWTTVAAQQIG